MASCPTCGIDPAQLTAIRQQVEALIARLMAAENPKPVQSAAVRVRVWGSGYSAETAREQAQRSIDG